MDIGIFLINIIVASGTLLGVFFSLAGLTARGSPSGDAFGCLPFFLTIVLFTILYPFRYQVALLCIMFAVVLQSFSKWVLARRQ
jgi:hypothetical protein